MPRKPRFYLPRIPAHVIQRENDRQPVFFDDQDYQSYLDWLKEGATKYGCQIHAYVLMTNHVHLLLTPFRKESIGRMIQHVGRRFVTYINKTYGRSGTLWEGRHKGSLVSSGEYFLACSRYIELNPVRAGMVQHPRDYAWSSYHGNAISAPSDLLTHHPLYLALGNDATERRRNYRELFGSALDPNQVHEIRASVQTGTPLGNERFKTQVERRLQQRVGQAKRGRPRKTE